jgi:NAD-dependent dihydropyrimidine dehydrogenase PreA subunit
MEHPILTRIARETFTPLGWFSPTDLGDTRQVILIGNAGPDMFARFARSGAPTMDVWTRVVVDVLAEDLGAKALYPFDKPAHPFLTWAQRGGAGFTSPLGLNIHPTYGLWHAYRAALLFPVEFDLPRISVGAHPCESCVDKPCLSACPVDAFDGSSYDIAACGEHIKSEAGQTCMDGGCLARGACPVGTAYKYHLQQTKFHMRAFRELR